MSAKNTNWHSVIESAKRRNFYATNVIERNGRGSSLWNELDRLHDELSGGFFSGGGATRGFHNPPVNVYLNQDDVLLTALVPGFDPSSIELLIIENKVQIKGTHKRRKVWKAMKPIDKKSKIAILIERLSCLSEWIPTKLMLSLKWNFKLKAS